MSEVFAKGVEKETGNDMLEKFRRTVEKSPLIKVTICYIDTECVLKEQGHKNPVPEELYPDPSMAHQPLEILRDRRQVELNMHLIG